MRTQAYFIEHCNFENCDLGTFTYTCPHCKESIDILKNIKKHYEIPFKNIDFDQCQGGKDGVVAIFKKNKNKYDYDENHTTRTIIFFNQKFVGGNSELKRLLFNT